jgi:hypothetical protein
MKDKLFTVHRSSLPRSSFTVPRSDFIVSSFPQPFLAQPVCIMLPFSLSPAAGEKQLLSTMTAQL